MTNKQYSTCVTEAQHYTDREAYISDLALSSMWEDDKTDEIPAERLDAVSQIWDAAHRSVKQIAADAGMSQRKLAERFCIPYRTIENWGGGKNACPLYIRLMMQEILGLLQRS